MNIRISDKQTTYFGFRYRVGTKSFLDSILAFNVFWIGSDAVDLFDKELELLSICDKKNEN